MSNIALFLVGGIGLRMKQEIPKQFLTVDDKPIIIYTLENFQNHPEIDVLAVSCLEGWENFLQAYAKKFKITKLKHIFKGGETGLLSARNGLFELEKIYKADDVVLIHDGNRPMTSAKIISDCIATTKKFGNAYPALPSVNTLLISEDDKVIDGIYPRENVKKGHTPLGFFLKDICDLHRRAAEIGINNSVGSGTMAVELGVKVHLFSSEMKNFKITTSEDLEIFKALLQLQITGGGG